jgi:hypothetical protein
MLKILISVIKILEGRGVRLQTSIILKGANE